MTLTAERGRAGLDRGHGTVKGVTWHGLPTSPAHADVSEATVSRVLNGKPGVAEATRQAVLTSLDVLGYDRPSRLRRKSAGLVGLIVPELTNPIFPAFAQIIETALARHGFTPVLCTQTPGGVHEDDYVQMLLDRGVAGIIYVSGQHADTTTDPERYARAARARPADRAGQRLPRGHRRPVHLQRRRRLDGARAEPPGRSSATPGSGWPSGPERYVPVHPQDRGLPARRCATLLGRDDVEELIERDACSRSRAATAAGARLIEKGCTAVVCGSDLMALGAIRAARRAGLRVPDDFSVVGYDDSPLIAFTDPPLTTVRQSVQAMAEAAVRALLDEIAGRAGPARRVRLPARARRARLDRTPVADPLSCVLASRLSRRRQRAGAAPRSSRSVRSASATCSGDSTRKRAARLPARP